jgi:SAM-dependent methyltransferase
MELAEDRDRSAGTQRVDVTRRVLVHGGRQAPDPAIERAPDTRAGSGRGARREPTRADWRILLGVRSHHVVLDAGSGEGRLAAALAPAVRHIVSLEASSDLLELQRRLLRRREVANVSTLDGDLLSARLAPGSFDWVILRPGRRSSNDGAPALPLPWTPEVLAAALLALRPGGKVLLIARNRWTPRGLLDARSLGLAGYRRALRKSGVDDVAAYAALPHGDTPRTLVPLDPPCGGRGQRYAIDQAWKRASPGAALARMCLGGLAGLGVMPYFYPHYLLVARKPC